MEDEGKEAEGGKKNLEEDGDKEEELGVGSHLSGLVGAVTAQG